MVEEKLPLPLHTKQVVVGGMYRAQAKGALDVNLGH